jgi:PPOX class probable F420-dependent enzyme
MEPAHASPDSARTAEPQLPTAGAALTPPPLPDRIRAFLEVPRDATIATINPDGSPHQAVVWFALDGDELLINSRPHRRWPKNLDRDDRISVAVPDPERPSHWVGVKGRAEKLRDGDEAVADIQALARRYGEDPEQYAGQDRVTFRVAPLSTFEYGVSE